MSNSQTISENNERINAVTELLRSKAVASPTEVYDGLDSESTTSALSANQGRVLNETITATANSLDDYKMEMPASSIIMTTLVGTSVSAKHIFQNGIKIGGADLQANSVTGVLTANNVEITTKDNIKQHTAPVLIFDTSTRDTGTYSFLDDISNYNLLVFCGYETGGNSNTYVTTTVDAFRKTDSTYQMQVANNSVDKNRYVKLYYKSDTSFIITAFGNFNFRRVYGIK